MKCLCRTCGLTFSSEGAFAKHRVGEFNHTPPHYGRRCLTVAEMTTPNKKGRTWRTNVNGHWTREPKLDPATSKTFATSRCVSPRNDDRHEPAP